MQENLNIKKQGLQLLVETYLRRRGPEDIRFMEKQLRTADNLASSVNSDLQLGLSPSSLVENDELYGSNLRRVPEDHQMLEFSRILREELVRGRVVALVMALILQFACGSMWSCDDLRTSAIFVMLLMAVSMSVKVGLRWRSFTIASKDNFGKKLAKVSVMRHGERYPITENLIKVGDVLFIDFNETIPVSGVLISQNEITVDEEFVGRGVQRKVKLEKCLKEIENKSDLQLKIDFENGSLPSPVLLRGSRAVAGGTFKMLAIATEEETLLQRYSTNNSDSADRSILEEWISSISKDLQHVSQFCFLLLVAFHVIGMIFKVLGLPVGHYESLLRCIVDGLHTLVVGSFLLDACMLADLLRGEYLGAMALVGRGSELDKLLAVEQILITDENICKYDQITPRKVMLSDMHEPVEIRLLPAMQDAVNYHILYEIMGGVQLEAALPLRLPNKFHKNPIVHVNNSQEKIFSSLYEHCAPAAAPIPQADEGDSIAELMRHNRHLQELQTEKPNKVGPEPSESLSESAQGALVRGEEEKEVKLSEYLSRHCQFSTQNIIEGLNKLAKNESRTYYFQKFSLERLSRVRMLWAHGKFAPIRAEERERLLQGIKKLERENLTVYLIGLEEGAFSHQYMSFLFGAVGVQITHESTIINKLKSLQRIGVSSLITIFKSSFEEMNELQRHQYEYDFLKRGWMNQNEHFCKLEEIKRAGGRLVCSNCLLSACACRPKQLELADVQGFLNAIEEVKCIYNLTEDDIEYIQLGFEQLNTSTLRIVDRKEDSIGRLSQIIAGHQLVSTLEENLSFWVLLLLLAFFYYFPLNFVTFGHIFCKEQLYFYFVYIQLLLARHHFMRNSEELRTEHTGASRKSKNLFGWAIKGDLLVFLLLLIASSLVILFFPHLFISEDFHVTEEDLCFTPKSFYHNPDIKTYVCREHGNTVYHYSQVQTFIFVVTMLAITFKTFVSSSKIFALINLAFHFGLIGILMAILYLFPNLLHLSHGLSSVELSLAFFVAFMIVFLSKFNRWIIGALQGGKRFQLTLNISITKRYNEYAEILREFKEGKTLKYPYEEHQ